MGFSRKRHKSTKEYEKIIRKQMEPFTDVPIVFISALTNNVFLKLLKQLLKFIKTELKKLKLVNLMRRYCQL